MLPAHLITFEQAAAQLGISESALDDLIDAGTLTTQPYLGDIYLLADQVTAQASANPPAPKPRPQRPTPDDAKLRRIQSLLDTGVREVRAAQAAELLGISNSQLAILGNEGRVNYELRRNRRWYLVEDIETYARLQNVWASKSGGWTPYGKSDDAHHDQDMILAASAMPAPSRTQLPDQPADDYRIDFQQACDILCLTESRVRQLVRQGKLDPVRGPRPFAKRDKIGRPITRWSPTFSASQVYALAAERERRAASSAISPTQWKERMVKPFIRTKIEAPLNDILVTRAEAAAMLGVGTSRITALVRKGRLFGWQASPGKPGSPLYLSGNQVVRYRDNPDRQKHRESYKRGPRPPSRLGEETEAELWLENNGMAYKLRMAETTSLDRRHGDFLNARQAGKLLGISGKSVNALRQRGRINGYQKPRKKADGGGNKWWFYRMADVESLLLNPEYTKHRNKSEQAKPLNRPRWRTETEPEW